YSPRDIAGVLAKIYGKPVEIAVHPLEGVVPTYTGFGISPNIAGLFQEMYDGVAKGIVAFEGNGARLVRGTVDAETALRGLGAGAGAAA
ncbi:MAG: hypothetical protein QOI41_2185, partial [Myxococcales bacterium]|nr:hypothetical protein [Myxococcales bacterium]